jgi:four helix bundle protein
VSKLSDAETEAAETQTWIRFALACGYLAAPNAEALNAEYDAILSMLVAMIAHPKRWTI